MLVRRCLLTAVCLIISFVVAAQAGATPLSVALDIQGAGLTVAAAGTGGATLHSGGSGSLAVDIGGPVQAALLYWSGEQHPCPTSGGVCIVPFQPFGDQVVRFNGTLITGTIIGTEQSATFQNNLGYLADVTSIVQAAGTGSQTFSFADGDLSSNLTTLDGAGLIVFYTDPGDLTVHRVILFDGLDFVGPADPTANAITFNHGSAALDRAANLLLLGGNGTAGCSDTVSIANNPSQTNTFIGHDGPSWDTNKYVINIPSGVSSTAVNVSVPPGGCESLRWEAALLTTGPLFADLASSPSVPEPSSILLMVAGVTVVGARALRSARRAGRRR